MLPDYRYPRRWEVPSSSKACRWTGMGVVMTVKASRPPTGWMRLAAMVASPPARWRSCVPARRRRWPWWRPWPARPAIAGQGDRAGPARAGGGGAGEQHRRELVLHVPGDVVGQYANEHVGLDRSSSRRRMGRISRSVFRPRKTRSRRAGSCPGPSARGWPGRAAR